MHDHIISQELKKSSPTVPLYHIEHPALREGRGSKRLRAISACGPAILFVAAFSFIFGWIYLSQLRPIYETNMVIQVGPNVREKFMTVLTSNGNTRNDRIIESDAMGMLNSRSIVTHVLDHMKSYTSCDILRFPSLEKWFYFLPIRTSFLQELTRRNCDPTAVTIDFLNLPDRFFNEEFRITSLGNGRYQFENKAIGISKIGLTGQILSINTQIGTIKILLSRLTSPPGAVFHIMHQSTPTAARLILENLELKKQQSKPETIMATLRGRNAKWITDVLAGMGKEYIDQTRVANVEQARTLSISIADKTSAIRRQVEEAERRYDEYRNNKGVTDPEQDANFYLQQLTVAKNRRSDLEQKQAELMMRFTNEHPIMLNIETQKRLVDSEIKTLVGRIRALPLIRNEMETLKRDVSEKKRLYLLFSEADQQLRLSIDSYTTGIRIIDMPLTPDYPSHASLSAGLGAGVCGSLIATALILLSSRMKKTIIQSPSELEKFTYFPVCATVSYTKSQKVLNGRDRKQYNHSPLLAHEFPFDKAIENLRTFRAALQYSSLNAQNNIMLFVSPTESSGKSFITANLAVLLGSTKKRVLLIDADIRNGALHRHFGIGRQSGLSEVISGNQNISMVIHREVASNVDFISAGNSFEDIEMLMRPEMECILKSLSSHYDSIIINGSAIINIADSLSIARYSGAVYLVIYAGKVTRNEIIESEKILGSAGVFPRGYILNAIKRTGDGVVFAYGYKNRGRMVSDTYLTDATLGVSANGVVRKPVYIQKRF